VATRTRCLGNQKQMGTGYLLFYDDYQRLPNHLDAFMNQAWTGSYGKDPTMEYLGGSTKLRQWLNPVGGGVDNAALIANVPNWCSPNRAFCNTNDQWQVHIGCHGSRTEKQIKDDWITRYPVITCRATVKWTNPLYYQAVSEHLSQAGDAPEGGNIFFFDGHAVWRPVRTPIWQPHPTVAMPTDSTGMNDNQGWWFFGYSATVMMLPGETSSIHPDQTNYMNKTTGKPDSVVRPYWMR
jgi:prepilin-type processing-associated H-X9-DG protein